MQRSHAISSALLTLLCFLLLGVALAGGVSLQPVLAQEGDGPQDVDGHIFLFLPMLTTNANAAGQAVVEADHTPQAVRAEVIVVLRDHVANPGAVAEELSRRHQGHLSFVYTHALKGFSLSVPESALDGLARDPRVAYVERDQEVHLFDQTVPTGIQRIFADSNTNITIDGNDDRRIDVDVAVIDTGIDLDHPDLNVVASVNCSGGSPFKQSCGSGGDDDNGHGTHVAGSIAAIDNSIGVVGVAPGSRLWAVKVLRQDGSGYISWIVAGIDYVTANAGAIEVANMSLGCECQSQAMDTAISNSVAAGVVYAVAAGNNDKDASTFSPANHPDVITVSALADFDGEPGGLGSPTCRADEDDTLANFSNWGSLIDVAAPGVCILSTWPGGGYNTISGTSMASPHVAGAAALLASMNKPTNQTQALAVRQTIINTGNLNWTDDSGDGIKEPLLDVSNQTIYNPKLVPGSSGSTDNPPSVSISSPANGSTVAGVVPIQIEATDTEDGAGTLTVQWSVDGGAWQETIYNIDSGRYEAPWTTTTVSEGSHTINARATDSGGNTTTASPVTVEVDNVDDPPTAAIVSPANGSTVSGAVTIQVEASDDRDAQGTLSVAVSIDGSLQAAPYNLSSGYYELVWDTGGLTDATTHTIDAQATDSGGNTTNAAQVTVTVDNSTPETMHVAALDGASINQGSTWKAVVTITIHDASGQPVNGATVSGGWTQSGSGATAICTTDGNGKCQVESGNLPKRTDSTTFTVGNVTGTLIYEPADNVVTSITVSKP